MSVVNRERRKNAGTRMAILGKKMEEDDAAFWSHETWADEEDSGNESFHESDEDSALKKDVFDSDFNDSESDNEDDELAAGEAEERELRKSERTKRRHNSSNAFKDSGADFSTAGGHKRKRGFSGTSKRAIGEGFNAGIVLNLPPGSYDSLSYSASITAKRSALPQLSTSLESTTAAVTDTKRTPTSRNNNLLEQPIVPPTTSPHSTTTSTTKAKTKKPPAPARKLTRSSQVSLRERRSTHGARRAPSRRGDLSTPHTATVSASARKASSSNGSDTISRVSTAAKRKRYAQEELLLEAVHETEPENQRWLHGRKRVQDQYNRDKDSNAGGLRDKYRGKKIIQKFHSRRGCLITLTFPEMDAVPEILTRRQQSTTQQHQSTLVEQQEASQLSPSSSSKEIPQPQFSRCVITGKIGKYIDPLTKYPYHNLAAFKELRRRHKDGVAIVTQRVVTSSSKCIGDRERKNPVSRKKISKAGKNLRSTAIVENSDNNKNTEIACEEEGKKLSVSAINTHHKLPFQSPKPPPKPTINGKSSLPKTSGTSKPHPSDANIIATNQQQTSSVESLAFSWGRNPNSSIAAKDTTSTKSSNLPVSPSSRRLSPRKRKPSEKILETIGILPEKDYGHIAAVPPGLEIQPLLTSLSSNHQCLDSSKSKKMIGYAPALIDPSSPGTSEIALAPQSPSPDKGNNQTTKNITIESAANGGSYVPTSTVISGNLINKDKSLNATLKSREVVKDQHLVNVRPPITGSSITVAIGDSKGNAANDGSRTQVLPTPQSIADTAPLIRKIQQYNSSSDTIIETKLEDSTSNRSASIAASGDRDKNTNMTGQV